MKLKNIMRTIGPAFIMASVVLGPGSITTATKAGFAYGYQLLWVVVLAALAMAMYVYMASRFGVSQEKSILQTIAETFGRWFAGLIGVSCFLMASSFQFGNNLGVATSMQSLTGISEIVWPIVFTSAGIVLIFFARNLYKVLEKLMMYMVMLMITAFFINLIFARPDLKEAALGLIPSAPKGSFQEMASLVGTTFCLHVALFQAYLVRDKGWKLENLKTSITDTIAGISMLAGITILIIMTSAAALRPLAVTGLTINSAADMAIQLQALFGPLAHIIFSIGLWAAAFSSLTVNMVVGGGLMADGLGLGNSMQQRWPKIFTALGMLIGMLVGEGVILFLKGNTIPALVFAQGASLFAVPAVAIGLFMISNNRKAMGRFVNNWKQNVVAVIGLLLILAMCWRMYHFVFSFFANR